MNLSCGCSFRLDLAHVYKCKYGYLCKYKKQGVCAGQFTWGHEEDSKGGQVCKACSFFAVEAGRGEKGFVAISDCSKLTTVDLTGINPEIPKYRIQVLGPRYEAYLKKRKRPNHYEIVIGGVHYKNRIEAAQKLGIPLRTFIRHLKEGKIRIDS